MMIKRIGILPWVGSDQHQINFANALEKEGYVVEKIRYKKGFPLSAALEKNIDLLVLDWVHSFFISESVLVSLFKTSLQFVDRLLVRNRKIPIIWNMHNLHRHDKKHQNLEKFNFKKLAACVDGIRVFNDFSVNEVKNYLGLKEEPPVLCIPQGEYKVPINNGAFSKSLYGFSNNVIVILFFGSIRSGKGLDVFLNTFSKNKNKNIKLIVAGKSVEEELAKKVKFLALMDERIVLNDTFIPDEQVTELFLIADLVVLPYESISNSGVQLLAHSFAKPILANDIPIFRSTLSGDYTEFFRLGDENSLNDALKRFMDRDIQEMKSASEGVLKYKKWDKVIHQFIEFATKLEKKI